MVALKTNRLASYEVIDTLDDARRSVAPQKLRGPEPSHVTGLASRGNSWSGLATR